MENVRDEIPESMEKARTLTVPVEDLERSESVVWGAVRAVIVLYAKHYWFLLIVDV
jgi:hypothetical protein